MNINVGGGVLASPVVKAVLDALGVSYVVEQGSDESGSWYRRFSNGWVEQGGYIADMPYSMIRVTYPVEFRDENYVILMTANGSQSVIGWSEGFEEKSKMTTGINLQGNYTSDTNLYSWEAKGYAA